MSKQKKLFKTLRVLNIYLKSVTFEENNPGKRIETLNVFKDIQIIHKEGNHVSYILEKKITTNKGEKIEITVKVGIDINIEFNDDATNDVIDKELKNIAERIAKVNYIDNKISLLIGNITSSFGENPIIFPTDTLKKVKE